VHAIDTRYLRPGHDASHLILSDGRAAFVDTGPASAVPYLLDGLRQLGVAPEQVDYVFLTHVHLDHAGGAGVLMQSLPNAQAVLHPRGARHMIDPSRLIAGSIGVYGEEKFRSLYGEIRPIDGKRVVVAEDGARMSFGGRELELIHTPGHALHHYCAIDRTANAAFTGDNFGLSYREFDTARGAFIFPTTTPVQFDPEAMHASIDRLMSYEPRAMYLTHFSRVTDLVRLASDLHTCVDAYVSIARRTRGAPDSGLRLRAELFDFLSQRLDAHGYRGDAARRHEMLDNDCDLNAQGLEMWLERGAAANLRGPEASS
jgi:glyoxylase-like metal-dependent hydrolase (beta-lactamase superfamily II)